MRRFWDWLDERCIIRRALTIATFTLVAICLHWSMRYAESSARAGADVAMILGAIWTPLSALMGYMFGQYASSRREP